MVKGKDQISIINLTFIPFKKLSNTECGLDLRINDPPLPLPIVARQWLSEQIPMVTITHAATEELLDAV